MTQITLWLLERTLQLQAGDTPSNDWAAQPFVCLPGQLLGAPHLPWYTLSRGQFASWAGAL